MVPYPPGGGVDAMARVVASDDEVKARIHAEGGDPMTSTPAEYSADIVREETKWSALVHKLNLKVE